MLLKRISIMTETGGPENEKTKGLAILLFAILMQLCSSGMELLTLAIGLVGLVVAIFDDMKIVEFWRKEYMSKWEY